MEWLGGFILGFFADLMRSTFLPASTEWISRHIPSARIKTNVEENVIILDVMAKLESLGKDPALVKHFRDDADKFMSVLISQKDAFVDNAIENIDSTYMTQVEMNMEADRRAEVARKQMERAIIALERSGWMSSVQTATLLDAQAQWEKYAHAQAQFVSAEYEGGSMRPLVFSSELETATLSRTGELRRMLDEMQERYGE